MLSYIGVVVVTYNRLDKLKKALGSFESQIMLPKYILVVNNHSNDGTYEYLNWWKNKEDNIKRYVINCSVNSGGSGGFYTGLEFAVTLDASWIWVSDDDAYPEKDALYIANEYIDSIDTSTDNVAAICSSVIEKGEYSLGHRRRIFENGIRISEKKCDLSEYKNDSFLLNAFSYVGAIMNTDSILQVGLPEKEFFIYYDDTEHSLRLSKLGKIVCVPKIKVIHDSENSNVKNIIDWKNYYGTRNRLIVYKKHFKFRLFLIHAIYLFLKTTIQKIKGIDSEIIHLKYQAFFDAIMEKKGMHDIYKPGWNIGEDRRK